MLYRKRLGKAYQVVYVLHNAIFAMNSIAILCNAQKKSKVYVT